MTLAHDLLVLLATGRPLDEAAAAIERSLGARFPGWSVRLEAGPGAGAGAGAGVAPGDGVRVAAVAGGRTVGAVVLAGGPAGRRASERPQVAVLEEHAGLWALCLETVRRRRDQLDRASVQDAEAASTLHDGAMQQIVAVDLGLQRLRHTVAPAVLAELRERCGDALAELRRVVGELDPLVRGTGAADLGALVELVGVRRLEAAGVPAVLHVGRDGPGPALTDAERRLFGRICAGLVEGLLGPPAATAVAFAIRHDDLGRCLRADGGPTASAGSPAVEAVRAMAEAAGGSLRWSSAEDGVRIEVVVPFAG